MQRGNFYKYVAYLDNKVHGANMGPTWVLPAPGGPRVDPMNLAIMVHFKNKGQLKTVFSASRATFVHTSPPLNTFLTN